LKTENPQLSILTPTWNRRALLPRLYLSLVEQIQHGHSFEWVVVDDGSTDDTIEWLSCLVSEAPFPIKVIQQENGGKHRALNRGSVEINSPWVLVVDSDDWLLPQALKDVSNVISEAELDVCAVLAPLKIDNSAPRGFGGKKQKVRFCEWMRLKSSVGDVSFIFRSQLLKEYPFPEFESENFMAESVFYGSAFSHCFLTLSDIAIMGAEYQPDGLSARSLRLRVDNPLGALANYDVLRRAGLYLKQRVRSDLNFHRFYWHALISRKNPVKHGFRLNAFWMFPALILYLSDRWRIRSTGGTFEKFRAK
jgi:glycosyltransferase involved in cell wall biosynthesis